MTYLSKTACLVFFFIAVFFVCVMGQKIRGKISGKAPQSTDRVKLSSKEYVCVSLPDN